MRFGFNKSWRLARERLHVAENQRRVINLPVQSYEHKPCRIKSNNRVRNFR